MDNTWYIILLRGLPIDVASTPQRAYEIARERSVVGAEATVVPVISTATVPSQTQLELPWNALEQMEMSLGTRCDTDCGCNYSTRMDGNRGYGSSE